MRNRIPKSPAALSTIAGSEATGVTPTDSNQTPNLDLVKPPMNYDEFVASQGLTEWPARITSEEVLSLSDEAEAFGNLEDMINLFREAAPIDMSALDKIGDNLAEFEKTLLYYADKMLNIHGTSSEDDESQESENDESAMSSQRFDKSDPSEALTTRRSKGEKTDSIAEMKRRAVENCSFPGFLPTELTQLPGSLEGPQILHRVMKAVDVNPGFRKFWKKIFLSEASVAVFQDSFWWFFIELFEKQDKRAERSKLFDRVADSFAALFFSIHPEVKDKFFQIYPDSVCQALYSAFFEAFPESRKYFGDHFKQTLINTVFEWITGSHPMPGGYAVWNIDILERSNMPVAASASDQPITKTVAESVMAAVVAMNDPREVKLDMDSFHKTVKQLNTRLPPGLPVETLSVQPMGRPVSKVGSCVTLPPLQRDLAREQRKAPEQPQPKSHPMGPGPQFDRVLFDLEKQSPLIQHFLVMHGRQGSELAKGKYLMRSEVGALPPKNRPTYQEFVNEKIDRTRLMKDEYYRISQETVNELAAINRRKRDINRQIRRLQGDLDSTRNTLELKVYTDQIMDSVDQKSAGNRLTFQMTVEDMSDPQGEQ